MEAKMKKIWVILLFICLIVLAAVPVLARGVYPAWHQGFEHNTEGWITDDTAGAAGWCGDITRYERGSGPVTPSVGHGYAVVEHGACNDFYDDDPVWSRGSGPYAPFGGYSDSWPQSGFVAELDIYLDPGWAEGTGFDFYVSMQMLNEGSLRYLLFPVSRTGGKLLVAGHEVSDAGWHTFRVRFREVDGHLAVDFELAQKGRVLAAQPVLATAFTGEAISSFEVVNVGTGYAWFDLISEGLELPIDQHTYRPGR
jgi:hypothetical protein